MMYTPLTFKKNDGCNTSLYVRHALRLRNGGLVIAHHNEVHGKLLYLSWQPLPSHCVCGKHLIHQGCSRSEEEVNQGRGGLKTRGDVPIRGLWERQNDSIIDVKFGDADVHTYRNDPMDNIPACRENQNKDNHGKHCHKKRKYFLCLFYLLMSFLKRRPW